MYKKLLTIAALFITLAVRADEGMWLPQLLAQLNEKEMKSMGMKISAKDIYDINKGSLKDAVVQFGGGCTGEIISGQGLLLTNHHCGFGYIQRFSSLQNNYIRDGFWSKNQAEEIPAPGLSVTFISRIEEVTGVVLAGVTAGMSERDRQSQIDKNLANLRRTAEKESWEQVLIRPFFNGNKYFLFITVNYTDVRLVGAPPQSIGAFGADTDNWVWPRHGGDFSLFRVYADAQNRPAAYSASNKPFTPKHFLPISLDGVAEGDFTMVFGFPGRTNSYLPSNAVEQTANVLNPIKIAIRTRALQIMNEFMRSDEQIKIQYSAKYAGIANAWKKWMGESKGLNQSGAVAKKLQYEAEFMKKVNASSVLQEKYGTLLPDLNTNYKKIEPFAAVRDHFNETMGNVEILSNANSLVALFNATQSGAGAYEKEKQATISRMSGFFKDYQPKVDKAIFEALIGMYFKNVEPQYIGTDALAMWNSYGKDAGKLADAVFAQSALVSFDKLKALLDKPTAEVMAALNNDLAFKLADHLADAYGGTAGNQINELQPFINSQQRQYMQAQLEAFPQKRFYPDANSTMRVSYGNVKGYRARDGVDYHFYTYLDGVMEKYVPGDYEFDVPQKLIDLYKTKNFGQYATREGKMPVAFIAANHTTGGNSGSPAIDAYGNLVGLNFDRVWEGTMSDINYDKNICRNIMVDIRYVLFLIDKLGGATHLINELKLVHPKKKTGKK